MQPFAAGGLPGGSGTDSASMAAPPSIQELLGRSAGDLGISPQLAAWWSGDHDAAAPHWFAQEADLRAAYTKCATPTTPFSAHYRSFCCTAGSRSVVLAAEDVLCWLL